MNMKRFRRLMKKSWYRKRIKKLAVIWAVILCIASGMLALMPGNKADAQSVEEQVYYKYYHSVKIESGDTLWGYAELYRNPDGQSCEEYIKDVKRINHLRDDQLIADKTIVLPYYSTEYVCSR